MTGTELIQHALAVLGQRHDIRLWRRNVGAARSKNGRLVRFGLRGEPDIDGILEGGYRLAAEAKGAGDRLRPAQQVFLRMVASMGGCAIEFRSVDELERAIDEFLRAKRRERHERV